MAKPTICLSMIVRNESRVIERCLRSVLPHIDVACIVDTGSDDDTLGIADRVLFGVEREFFKRPWGRPAEKWWRRMLGIREVDFSHNRNEALALAEQAGTDVVMVIDADEELFALPGAFDGFDARAGAARFVRPGSEQVWIRNLLLKARDGWRYSGRIDELPKTDDDAKAHFVSGVKVVSHEDGGRGGSSKIKYLRDAAVLSEEVREKPNDPRLAFNLATKLAAAGDYEGAQAEFDRRASMPGGWEEERYHSLLHGGLLEQQLSGNSDDSALRLMRAWQERPVRAEPLLHLSRLYRNRGALHLAELYMRKAASISRPPQDLLLVDESVYRWRAADELAGILAELGRLDESRALMKKALDAGRYPDSELGRVAENLQMIEEAA